MIENDQDDSERDDIRASIAGDEDAYWRIVERHGAAIQKQMRNFTRDCRQIEELAQDVFVEAYLGLKGYRGEAPFAHWLARIATRVGYAFWKSRERGKMTLRPEHAADIATPEVVERDPSLAGDPGCHRRRNASQYFLARSTLRQKADDFRFGKNDAGAVQCNRPVF